MSSTLASCMTNMKSLSLMVHNLWPRLKVLYHRQTETQRGPNSWCAIISFRGHKKLANCGQQTTDRQVATLIPEHQSEVGVINSLLTDYSSNIFKEISTKTWIFSYNIKYEIGEKAKNLYTNFSPDWFIACWWQVNIWERHRLSHSQVRRNYT